MNIFQKSSLSMIMRQNQISSVLAAVSSHSIKTSAFQHQIFNVQDMKDFEERVMKNTKPVLVDFHAEWCQPCKSLTPRLEKVVEANKDEVDLAKLNVDEFSEVAMQYNINSIPTVIGFRNGEKVNQFTGLLVEEQVADFVSDLIQK